MTAFLKRSWFPIGIVVAVLLGIVLGRAGLTVSPALSSQANRVLVVGLFFLVGLTLPTESIGRGMREWKLHVYLQLCIFVACPLLFAVAAIPFRGVLDGLVTVGFYALGCLPTTVSSCIVFTQSSDGNVVGSTFNAALANLAGVLLSPLILSLFLEGSGRALPADEVVKIVLNLVLTMLVPIVVGQLARLVIRDRVARHKAGISVLMNVLMLLVVLLALLAAASREDFVRSLDRMLLPFAVLAAANLAFTALFWGGARLLKLSRPSTISVLFVAPQKTLAMGAPLLATYFAGSPQVLAVALLPLLFYHPWQLVVAGTLRSLLKARERRRPHEAT